MGARLKSIAHIGKFIFHSIVAALGLSALPAGCFTMVDVKHEGYTYRTGDNMEILLYGEVVQLFLALMIGWSVWLLPVGMVGVLFWRYRNWDGTE